MTSGGLRYRQSPATLTRSAGEEVLLATADREGVDALSRTAAAVWRLLEVPRSLSEVATILGGRYQASADEIARDVRGLVDDLLARGLVERVMWSDG